MQNTTHFPRRMKLLALLSLVTLSASAADKIKVLIVDGQNNHDWRKITPVLKQILEEPGIFSVDVDTAPGGGGVATWSP